MPGILTKKSCFLDLHVYVCILLGASVMCNTASTLEVHTNKSVALWLGETGQSLPCPVRIGESETTAGLIWSKYNQSNVIVKQLYNRTPVGPGIESGDFSLSGEKSLVFNKSVQISDEGVYFCRVTKSGDSSTQINSSTIRVLSAPREPFPTIGECANNGHYINESCLLTIELGRSLNLTCDVNGFRPLVSLEWSNQSQPMSDVFRTLLNNSDGSQYLAATIEVTAHLGRQEFVCNVSGEVVQGHQWSKVIVEGVKVDPPRLPIIEIVAGAVVVLILLIVVVVICILWRKDRLSDCTNRSRKEEEGEPEKSAVSMAVVHTVDETRSREATDDEIQEQTDDELDDNAEEADPEVQDPLLTEGERTEDESEHESEPEPSRQPSMSSLQRLEFEQSWVVCVKPEDTNNGGNTKEVKVSPPPEPQPRRPGPISSVLHGVGSVLNTFNDFLRHDA